MGQNGTRPNETGPYTVADLQVILGLGRNEIYAACRRGEIPSHRIGRRLVLPRAMIDAWLLGQDRAISSTATSPPRR
jgi:excisionase family DNA binding protein